MPRWVSRLGFISLTTQWQPPVLTSTPEQATSGSFLGELGQSTYNFIQGGIAGGLGAYVCGVYDSSLSVRWSTQSIWSKRDCRISDPTSLEKFYIETLGTVSRKYMQTKEEYELSTVVSYRNWSVSPRKRPSNLPSTISSGKRRQTQRRVGSLCLWSSLREVRLEVVRSLSPTRWRLPRSDCKWWA